MRYALVLTLATLSLPLAASADDGACQQLRDRGYDACYHQNDLARSDCAGECGRCAAELSGCWGYCERFCDAPYPDGCNFDLNFCVSSCNHHCHEPSCEANAGCKSAWCSASTIKQCTETCQATYGALASCRSSWCGDGKSRKACLSSCESGKSSADTCRKAWCGDGKRAQQCFHDADETEQKCRQQVDAGVKACLAKK